jgi:TonB family C-terminal domain
VASLLILETGVVFGVVACSEGVARNAQDDATCLFSGKTITSPGSGVDYPEMVKNAGIEGTVEVTSRLGESGEARNPRVSQSVHEALDARVLRSVRNTTFQVRGNQPVGLAGEHIHVRFTYQLPDTHS